jgi:hypothetical protein
MWYHGLLCRKCNNDKFHIMNFGEGDKAEGQVFLCVNCGAQLMLPCEGGLHEGIPVPPSPPVVEPTHEEIRLNCDRYPKKIGKKKANSCVGCTVTCPAKGKLEPTVIDRTEEAKQQGITERGSVFEIKS